MIPRRSRPLFGLFSGTRLLTWAIAVTLACGAVGLSAPEFASARTATVAAAPADRQVDRDGVPAAAPTVTHRVCHHHVCNVCHKCDDCHKDHCKKGDRGDRGPRGFQGPPGKTADIDSLFVPGPLVGAPNGATFTLLVPGDGSVWARDPRPAFAARPWLRLAIPGDVIAASLTGPTVPGAPVRKGLVSSSSERRIENVTLGITVLRSNGSAGAYNAVPIQSVRFGSILPPEIDISLP